MLIAPDTMSQTKKNWKKVPEMKRNIYFIRHGQSMGNLLGIIQGHHNAPLTELGLQQAQCTASWFAENQANLNITGIYSSDLQRAQNTALEIGSQLGISIIETPDIREAFFGKWEGQKVSDIMKEDPDSYTRWVTEKKWRPEWCESFDALQARSTQALQTILKQSDGNLIVVSHGGFIYSLVDHYAPSQLQTIQNCSITHLISDEDIISVESVSQLAPNTPNSPPAPTEYTDIIYQQAQRKDL